MARVLKLTPGESVEIRQSTPELLEVEATYSRAESPPPKHFHPSQDEHFEVLAGTMSARVGDEKQTLRQGDTLDIPRGVPHQMWNPNPEQARVLWQTSPAGRTEQWFASLDALQREGRVRGDGMPSPLAFGVYLTEYRDVFRLAVAPDLILRPVFGVLGLIGRARGYSPAPAD